VGGAWDRREGLAALALLAVCALWTGLGLGYEATGRVLGTASPPFVAGWVPEVEQPVWLVLAAVAVGVLVAGAPWLLRRAGSRAFAAALLALATVLVLAANAAKTGTEAWTATFDLATREGRNEYLAALGALSYGRELFLDRFAETVPSLPAHAAGHPPGLLLLIDLLALDTKARLSAVCLAAVVLVPVVTWRLARAAGAGEERARLAALLACASPALLLYGGTSADALFALVGAVSAWLLVRGGRVALAGGAALLALGSVMAWSLLAIGAWAALLVLVVRGWRAALVVAVACGVAVLALDGALAALYGYDPISTLRRTNDIYRDSLASVRPYWFWSVGSPVAFLVTLGIPTAAAFAVALVRRHPAALAIGGVLLIAAVLGFTKAEVERIWLMFVPLCAVAAALALPDRAVRPVLAALGVQVLLTTSLLNTLW
jgi:methylthioxylose transferase